MAGPKEGLKSGGCEGGDVGERVAEEEEEDDFMLTANSDAEGSSSEGHLPVSTRASEEACTANHNSPNCRKAKPMHKHANVSHSSHSGQLAITD